MISARLRPGDRVAVVSASGPVDADALARGIAYLRERYVVADDPRCTLREGYLAGDDATRAAALLEAVCDSSVRGVIASRGGYGSMRVLERVGDTLRDALRRDPKVLHGYSDVTALHALWHAVGVRSVHGPMVGAIGRGAVTDADRDLVVRALEGDALPEWSGLEVWRDGEAEGRAIGGNLALIAALQGTPHAMSFDDAIVFLEDITERPYRVDRMLTTLRLAGAFARVRGVVVGDFVDCATADDGVTVEAVLRDRLVDLGVPVVAGAPFGHGARQRSIPFGDHVRIVRGGTVAFEPPV